MKRTIKKILVVGVAAFLLFLTACSAVSGITASNPLPWQYEDDYTHAEISTYAFKRYLGSDSGDNAADRIITEDTSFLRYELYEGASVEFDEEALTPARIADRHSALLIMTMSVKYKTASIDFDVPEIYSGREESMTSYVVFSKYSTNLQTKFSFKSIVYRDAEQNGKEVSQYYYTDYVGGPESVLGERKSVVIDKFGEKHTLSVDGGSYFDNEFMYFHVRASSALRAGAASTETFLVTNPVLCFVDGNSKLKTYKMKQTSAEALANVAVSETVYSFFKTDGLEQEDGEFLLPTIHTQIVLDADATGSPMHVYYASVPTNRHINNFRYYEAIKLPVKFRTELYNGNTYVEYTQVYELLSYSNEYVS